MPIRPRYPSLVLAAALIAGAPLAAQVAPREAAKAFTLDSVAPTPTPAPSSEATPASTPEAMPPVVSPVPDGSAAPASAPVLGAPTLPESSAVTTSVSAPTASEVPPAEPTPMPADIPAAPAPAVRGVFTLDTPIQDLIADTGARAVLDKDLPGMSDDENLAKFKMLSLRSFQPQTGGQLTDAMLAKVAADLDVLGGGSGAIVAPAKIGNAKRSKDDSR